MKALRNSISRHRAAVRLVALALACYTMLPVQLVWCHEDGPAPRLEASFNGLCIPGSNSDCCGGWQAEPADGCCSASADATFSECCVTEHCVGCLDQLVHNQQSVSPARALLFAQRSLGGGHLFSLATPALAPELKVAATLYRWTGHRIPSLTAQSTETIQLLI